MALDKRDIKEIRNPDGTYAKGNTTGALSKRGKPFHTRLKAAIKRISDEEGTDIDFEIAQKSIDKMREGDFNFIKMFWESEDGKALQRKEVSGVDGEPISIETRELVKKALDDLRD